MAHTVREFLVQHNKKNGYAIDDESLILSMVAGGNDVHKCAADEHGLFTIQKIVVDIEGTLIKYSDYIIPPNGSMRSLGLSYDIDIAEIVERKECETGAVYYE